MTKQVLAILAFLSPCVVLAQDPVQKDFQDNVVSKVVSYNAEIDKLSNALTAARASKSTDTVVIISQRKETVQKCFQVPQDYIKANPSSLYSRQALSLLGEGEPGYPVSVADLEKLFNSLSPELKDSDWGKAYVAQLTSWKERDKKK